MKKNKKGSILDIFLLVVIVFALGLIVIVSYNVFSKINTSFQANDDLSDNSKNIISSVKNRFVNLFDGIIIAFTIFFTIAIAVGVWYLDIHPVFYVPSILLAVIILIMAGVFSNAFSDVSETGELVSTTSEFRILPFMMNNFVTFMLFLTFLIIIVMYAKNRSEQF